MQFNSLSFVIFFSIVCVLMALTTSVPFRKLEAARRMRIRHVILLQATSFTAGGTGPAAA